ncbi:MAG TPA: NmrA family NAD(P)-binding protein [Candidatus Limnocylindrales bacterium]|nr:NmrA family NAD(P)-binding protein [Candidatus Limnocylindrales bacterium]
MIVITGATGNTGAPAAEALLAKGEKIRVVGRDAAKLERFASKGAEAFVGNAENASEMQRAFEGATVVYLVIPQALHREDFRDYQECISDAYASAVQKAGVKFAVTLSSIGGQNTGKVGPITGLHNMEEKLNRIPGLNVLHLRPATFMENLLMSIDAIRMMNVLAGAAPADTPIPTIATKDIGSYAATRLAKRNFSGHSAQELLGPRDVSMKETAAIVGRAIGKPNLAYVQMPLPLLESALASMGLPKSSAALLVELWKAANEGMLVPQETRSAENTTPTTIEQFAEDVFAPQFLRHAAKA